LIAEEINHDFLSGIKARLSIKIRCPSKSKETILVLGKIT